METIELLSQVFHAGVKAIVPIMSFNSYGFLYEGQYRYASIKVVSDQYFHAHGVTPSR